jgi:hypothetical protein
MGYGRAMATMGMKYGTGDLIAQCAAGSSSDIDYTRLGYFWAFGTYYGSVNYTFFRAFNAIPLGNPWLKALLSAFGDGCVHVPISFYPQFYFVRELVMSEEKRSLLEHLKTGLSKYQANWREDVITSAAIFMPIGIFNFRFVPLIWRTPFVSVVGVIFPIAVSWQRGSGKDT